ncbi:RING-CH-type domain-containing protein [Chloropicon primus]|nr:hypothetical protein A3770_15p74420 [Chloropicon primus]UPR04133.1 RING-CH-type domain-containing protein [Chloropicon primus]|eukprot:QDZ24924.1 hypothetical protein A3770_15p74420 [Chloropicon primus]
MKEVVEAGEVRLEIAEGEGTSSSWEAASDSGSDFEVGSDEEEASRHGEDTSPCSVLPSTSGGGGCRSSSGCFGTPEIVYWGGGQDGKVPEDPGEDEPYCRICFDGPHEDGPLFRACDCKGSVAYVHYECLSRWAVDAQRAECELCHSSFRLPEGMKPFIPKTPILHKACTIAAESMSRSTALFNLLPSGSGAVTSNSAIVYLSGYGHQRGCTELGICRFPTAFPRGILGEAMTPEEWKRVIRRINRVSGKMINMGWRFVIFILCLFLNICLIVVLSFIDHAAVIPFMFAVILIQLLPAVLFAFITNYHNARVHAQLTRLCSDLSEEFAPSGVTFGFHCITADLRHRGRLWNPYAVHPVGEPKVIKFLTVEIGTGITFGSAGISRREG